MLPLLVASPAFYAPHICSGPPTGLRACGPFMGAAAKKKKLVNAEDAEEAYWRAWFWDQAEEALDKRFPDASKRDLKRVREYIKHNRDNALLPKKLSKHPHYEVIGGYFPGLTTTPFHSTDSEPWQGLERAYPAIQKELQSLLEREQVRARASSPLSNTAGPALHCTAVPSSCCLPASHALSDSGCDRTRTLAGVCGRGEAARMAHDAHLLQGPAAARLPRR